MAHDTTETDTDDTIDETIAAYTDDLRALIQTIVTDATHTTRIERDLAEHRAARLHRERDHLRERLDALRDHLHNTTPKPDAPDAETETEAPGFTGADLLDTSPHDCRLSTAIQNGPSALEARVYPVHDRAHRTLTNLPTWGALVRTDDPLDTTGDSPALITGQWAVELTGPTVRAGLETQREESLSSTQTRRVFETIADWGANCPSPPRVDNTAEGMLRLRLFDGLAVSTALTAHQHRAPANPSESESESESVSNGGVWVSESSQN